MQKNGIELSAKHIFDTFSSCAHKKFGQNFLFDRKINGKIVSVAGDLSNKVVVEVGPGPGGLTLEILKQDVKKLHVIEFDEHWVSVWNELQPQFGNRLNVIHCDALKFDMNDLAPDIIISNLPYNISTQLLFKWMPDFHKFEMLILMFQKEVADRICATPRTKQYGKLSVLSQWKSSTQKVCDLEPGSFFPAPKVRSSVIRFYPYPGEDVILFEKFSEILTSAFAQRRKIVAKALSEYFKNVDEVLAKFGYGPKARAEEISIEDYLKILHEYRNTC